MEKWWGFAKAMGPLEVKVDSMLEKLSLLERMVRMLQKWENPEEAMSLGEKKEKSSLLKEPTFGLVATMPEESSIGARSSPQKEPGVECMPEQSTQPSKMSETMNGAKSEGGRIEALTRRLKMVVFDG